LAHSTKDGVQQIIGALIRALCISLHPKANNYMQRGKTCQLQNLQGMMGKYLFLYFWSVS